MTDTQAQMIEKNWINKKNTSSLQAVNVTHLKNGKIMKKNEVYILASSLLCGAETKKKHKIFNIYIYIYWQIRHYISLPYRWQHVIIGI